MRTDPKGLVEAELATARATLRRLMRTTGSSSISTDEIAHAVAMVLHARLKLYAASSWRKDQPGSEMNTDADALARRILILNDGRVPPPAALLRFIADVAKNSGGNGHVAGA